MWADLYNHRGAENFYFSPEQGPKGANLSDSFASDALWAVL